MSPVQFPFFKPLFVLATLIVFAIQVQAAPEKGAPAANTPQVSAPVATKEANDKAASPDAKQTATKEESLSQLIARNRVQNLRDFLSSRGVTQTSTQEEIIQSVTQQEVIRQRMQAQSRKLMSALSAKVPEGSAESQIKKLVEEFEKSSLELATLQRQQLANWEKSAKAAPDFRLKGALLLLGLMPDSTPSLPSWGLPGTVGSIPQVTEQ